MVGAVIGRLLGGLRPSPEPAAEPATVLRSDGHRPAAPIEWLFVAHTPILSAEAWQSQIHAAPGRVAAWAEAAARTMLSPAALTARGRLLLAGEGVPRDPAAAFDCFRRAAMAGHVDAVNMVGRCHELGWGVPADPAKAVPWYCKAAKAGDAWAQFNLANLLFDGQGIAADWCAARFWYLQAGRRRHAKAMNMLGRYCEEGWCHVPRPGAAFHWYRRGAEGGDFRAQFNYARLLFGRGRRDEALRWLEMSIDHGIPVFCWNAAVELEASADPMLRVLGARARLRAVEVPSAHPATPAVHPRFDRLPNAPPCGPESG